MVAELMEKGSKERTLFLEGDKEGETERERIVLNELAIYPCSHYTSFSPI